MSQLRAWPANLLTRAMLIAVVAITAFLVLNPTLWLIFVSFWSGGPGNAGYFTLSNYVEVFARGETYSVFLNTVVFAGLSTLIAFLFGIPMAWIVARTNTPLRGFLEIVAILPYMINGVVLAIGWILLTSPSAGILNLVFVRLLGLRESPLNIFSMFGMAWIGGLWTAPQVFLLVSAALRNQDASLEEAARMAGSSSLGIFARVTFPLIKPALIASGLLSFIWLLADFVYPAFIGIPSRIRVLTTQIYREYQVFEYGITTSYSVILLLVAMLLIYFYFRSIRRQERFVTVTGKGFAPRVMDLGSWKYATLTFALLYLAVAAILPFAVVVIASLVPAFTISTARLDDFSLRFYSELLTHPRLLRAFGNSVFLSVVGSSLTVLLGVVVAYLTLRMKIKGGKLLETLGTLPFAFPGIVLALGLLWAYISIPVGIYGTIWILLVAYMTRFMSYGIRSASSSLIQIHHELEDAGRIHGGGWLRNFRSVVLPLVKPALVASWIFLAITYLGEVSTSVLLYSSGSEVIGVTIYQLYNDNQWSLISSLGVLMTIVTIGLALFALRVTRVKALGV